MDKLIRIRDIIRVYGDEELKKIVAPLETYPYMTVKIVVRPNGMLTLYLHGGSRKVTGK